MNTTSLTEHTFDNGETIPFGVIEATNRTPHPLRLVPHQHRSDRIIAAVPAAMKFVPWRYDREVDWVLDLDCIHKQPAVIQTCRDGSLQLYCPDCRRRGYIHLAEFVLHDPVKEREWREAWIKAHRTASRI